MKLQKMKIIQQSCGKHVEQNYISTNRQPPKFLLPNFFQNPINCAAGIGSTVVSMAAF
jgi:hypothetical protein